MSETRVPRLVVCFGDSITEGGPHPEADRWPVRLQSLLNQSQPEAFEIRNCGRAGDTSAQGLERVGESVLSLRPCCVVIAFGINDCNVRPDRRTPRVGIGEFTSNLRELIRMIRAVDGNPFLLAPHYPQPDRRDDGTRKYDQGNGRIYTENFRPYHLGVRRVARQCETPLIDIPSIFTRARIRMSDFLMDDGVHLTVAGNHFYAEQVWRHLSV